MTLIKKIEHKGHEIEIHHDDSVQESPLEFVNDIFLSLHRDYEFTVHSCSTPSEIEEYYEDDYHLFPVRAYIHGGISLTILHTNRYPFNDAWDSGWFGVYGVRKDEFKDEDEARKKAVGMIECFNDYLNGNVYGYVTDNGDSCWGYLGDPEKSGLIDDAKGIIDYDIKQARLKQFKQVKAWIRNRVPLNKRIL